jgi:phage-related protein
LREAEKKLAEALKDRKLPQSIKELIKAAKEFRKEFNEAFKDANDAMNELGEKIMEQAQKALPALGTAAEKTADAFTKAINELILLFKAPEQMKTHTKILEAIPGIVEDFTKAAGKFILGIEQIIGLAMPHIEDFFNQLNIWATDFLNWTKSREGRREIKEWLKDGARLAEDIADFVAKAVTKLWEFSKSDAAKDLVNNLIDFAEEMVELLPKLTDAVKAFNDAYKPSEGDKKDGTTKLPGVNEDLFGADDTPLPTSWHNFFFGDETEEQMKRRGQTLGEAVREGLKIGLSPGSGFNPFKSLAPMWDWTKNYFETKSPSKRAERLGKDILAGLRRGILAMNPFNGLVEKAREAFNKLKERVGDFIGGVVDRFATLREKIGDRLEQARDKVRGWIDKVRDAFSRVKDILQAQVIDRFQSLREKIGSRLDQAREKVRGWIDKLRDALSRVKEIIQNQIVDRFQGLREKIASRLDQARDKVKGWVERVKDFFSRVKDIIQNQVIDRFQAMREKIADRLDQARDRVKGWIDKVRDFFSRIKDILQTQVIDRFQNMRERIQDRLQQARERVSDWIQKVRDFFSRIRDILQTQVIDRFKGMYERVKGWLEEARKKVDTWVTNIRNILGGLNLFSKGQDAITGFINGLYNKAGALWEAAKKIAENFLKTIKERLGIASPSKVFRSLGQEVGEGMRLGIEDSIPGILAASDKLAAAAIPGVSVPSMSIGSTSLGSIPLAGPGAGSLGGVTNHYGGASVTFVINATERAAMHQELDATLDALAAAGARRAV